MGSQSTESRPQSSFVNREKELQFVESTFDALLAGEYILITSSLIDFFGVEGIGKTSMLRQVERLCAEKKISHIWLDVGIERTKFIKKVREQLQNYIPTHEIAKADIGKGFYTSSVNAIQKLLERQEAPVVVLLDSIDTSDQAQFDWIETMLQAFIENPRFCAVFASKQKISFQRDWTMARKLAPLQLKPLDHTNSVRYIKNLGDDLPEEDQKVIVEWTRGYPLAIKVMAQEIRTRQLDLTQEEDQRSLVQTIDRRVIDEEVLAKVAPDRLAWYKECLSLLALPRRFNLVIIQDLFKRFGPHLVSDSDNKLAYIALPQELNVNTNVLNWDLQRVGFTIDQAVRTILLLQRRIAHPASFREIHAFLASKNSDLAELVTGTDRVRYLQEYLYHSAHSLEEQELPAIIDQTLQKILHNPLEEMIQFSEEFAQDEELREALKSNAARVDMFIKEKGRPEG